MNKVPSLISLCIGAIKDAILDEEFGNLHHVYVLPAELFDQIIPNLPSLALQNLQDAMPFVSHNGGWSYDDVLKTSRKRKRFENFETAWKTLYKLRWKDVQQDESTTNWQQIYWEQHLQNCLDAIAEKVSINLFDGFLGEVEIPDTLLQLISYEGQVSRSKRYSKLAYHFKRFGIYARCLRFQSVHCVAEIGNLLRNSRLENLEVNWLRSKEQVDGLCKLLEQNKGTLASVEFVDCELPANLMSAICDSLHVKGFETNVMKSFSIKRSIILDSAFFLLPLGLESLLKAARGLTSLILSDNHIWWKPANLVFDTLLEAESGLQVLDLSQNNITGFFAHISWGYRNCINRTNQKLNSLLVLNLRGSNLQRHDADCLKMLIPYLIAKSKSKTPLSELYLDNCVISLNGATQLLQALATLTVPLKFLSIGENTLLCCEFGRLVGRFLCSGIEAIDVRSTGLGSCGLAAAEREIIGKTSRLVSINISSNNGGVGTTSFLSKLISKAPNIISVKAGSNWIPVESVPAICSFLKATNGKLEHLDLQQNPFCIEPGIASVLAEFQVDGKPNILLSVSPPNYTHYDQLP